MIISTRSEIIVAKPRQSTDEEMGEAWKRIREAVSHLPSNKEKAIAAMEVGITYLANAIEDEGREVTDRFLLTSTHAMVAGWILAKERARKKDH